MHVSSELAVAFRYLSRDHNKCLIFSKPIQMCKTQNIGLCRQGHQQYWDYRISRQQGISTGRRIPKWCPVIPRADSTSNAENAVYRADESDPEYMMRNSRQLVIDIGRWILG